MKKKVLIVDDEASLRKMLRAVLENDGYSVEEANEGGDALRKIDYSLPDIILLDLMMPGIDGWDFLKLLQSHCERKGYDHVPRVVVVSAHPRMNPKELLGAGADVLVTKPFDIDELSTVLKHLPAPEKISVTSRG
jgi:CheY-like chemotaxis protein